MISRSELCKNSKRLADKAKGSMVAVAVGDALGDIGRSAEHRSLYGIVTDMYDGAKSTDDTEFAVLTARALLDSGGVLTYASVEQAWRRYIIDAGGMFARGGRPLYGAVKNLERGMSPPLSGRDNVFNTDDGAAMRIAPIGILFAGDPERAAAAAEIDARVSHDTSGVWSAQAVAAGVAVAMVDATADELAATMLSYIPDDSWLGRSMAKAVALCDAASSVEDVWAELHTEFHTPEHAAVEEAVPQSFAISVLTGLDFRTGMFWAANFGRDADTISAIVGAIAGARHGFGAIPHHWVEKVRKPAGTCLRFAAQEDVVNLGEELAELATKLGVGEPV